MQRATQELVPGECHVFHDAAASAEEADDICKRCEIEAVRGLVQDHASHFAVAHNQTKLDESTKQDG